MAGFELESARTAARFRAVRRNKGFLGIVKRSLLLPPAGG
jgi:hypothetical protein